MIPKSLVGIFAPVATALVCLALLIAAARWGRAPLDRPNSRSLHAEPVARVGGLAVIPAIGVGWLFVSGSVPWSIWVPGAALFAVSFCDDVSDLPVGVRLLVHLIAASIVAGAFAWPAEGWLGAVVTALGVAWMTNLYNFMDGSDGLAGGMTVIGFSVYALGALMAGATALALMSLAIVAAAAVFLRYNFHPARIFLGDAGSVPLGFLAAALGVQGWSQGIWPAWFPVFVFSPFIIDATVTLVRRALRGAKVWRAHREHYYQRLVQLGWGHRRTALAEYLLMGACGLGALAGLHLPAPFQALLLGIGGLTYAALMYAVDHAWSHERELSK